MGVAIFTEYLDGSQINQHQQVLSAGTSVTKSRAGCTCSIQATGYGAWTYTISGNKITFNTVDDMLPCYVYVYFVTQQQTYTVTYNANGGSVSPSSASGTSGTVVSLPTPSWTGHSFKGWYTAQSGGTRVGGGGSSYTITSTTTLWAQWNAVSYTVYYNAGGGSVSPTSASGNYGTVVTLPTPTYTGKTFKGWYTASSGGTRIGGGGSQYTITSTTTIYAQWTTDSYTVSFNANGGTVSPSSSTGTYGTVIQLPTPYRSNKTCTGWWSAASGGTKVGDVLGSYTITSTTTIYAQWVDFSGPGTVACLYYVDGTYTGQRVYNDIYGGSVLTFTRTGCTLTSITSSGTAGWNYTQSGNSITFTSVGDTELTLLINFTTNQIPVNYDGNGATSGSMSASSFTYGVAQALKTNAYSQVFRTTFNAGTGGTPSSEYIDATSTFLNWNNLPDGSGSYTYSNGQTVTNPCGSTGNAVTLYAQWQRNSITLPTATKAHSVFLGWYDSASGGNKIGDAGTSYTPSLSRILYAHWADDYLISYDANGGSVSPTSEYCHQGNSVTLPTPTKERASFIGWYTLRIGGYKVGDAGDSYTPNTSGTLYAHWESTEVVVIYDTTGGTIASGQYFKRVYKNEPYGELETPTKSGYTFDGWFTQETGGTQITSSSIVTATTDHTLYAHWTAVAVYKTLTFSPTGGTVSPVSRQVLVGGTIGSLPTPTRTGYTFQGWFNDTIGTTAITPSYVMPDENVTIYAKWAGSVLTITFDAVGGTPSEASRQIVYGNQICTLPTATKQNKTFVGWFTQSSGGTQITPSYVPTASQTLYAHWDDAQTADWWDFGID